MSSSGATESSTPFSGGAATDKPIKDEAIDSSSFREGEKVLAFHGPCLYDAKYPKFVVIASLAILAALWLLVTFIDAVASICFEYNIEQKKVAPPTYSSYDICASLVTFCTQLVILGLNRWDEWLGVNCLLKRTDENVQKQEELKKMHAMEKNAKPGYLSQDKTKSSIGVRGKKRVREIIEKEECVIPLEKLVNIQIPSTLKKQLIDDHECITHLGQLVKLPRSPSVYEILKKYFDYSEERWHFPQRLGIVETVGEIVKGLRCYFDKALPAMLLYKEERQQYKEVITDNVSPSNVYGAEHLLRLFVKLPEMLSCMHIETETLTELQQRLLDFLRFLQNNQSAFFIELPEFRGLCCCC
ncbi:hypothetical protein DH2020_035387 [Rehmannia glutinosa]|uniref:MRG domain-containing protein n=1 Tax=Rehmannia glutinosa TaxID=99300 RepID=A0ABR0V6L1_REHGL